MSDNKFIVGMFLYCYLVVSLIFWMIRVEFGTCDHLYMDYVFPITKLHCKVNP